MSHLTDTSPEASRVLTEVYRQMPIGRKWLTLGQDYRTLRLLHAAGFGLRHGSTSPTEVLQDWLAINYGRGSAEEIRGPALDIQDADSLRIVREVAAIFARLKIPYALGGSMASSVYGITRPTRDADITVEPFAGVEAEFAASFSPDYYLSLPAIRDAVARRSSFNIISTTTGFKVDVFVRKDRAFEESAMKRRRQLALPDDPGQPIALHSAEDVILFKLEWYRLSDESLDRQWTDVLGMLSVQGASLEIAYLEHWSSELKVSALLQRARTEAGN
ncbi:MAG TPA: hypothetical protein VGY66_35495 [Gemmataceae bacterium]|jgi:hypothetical protein|nr:hypothetical protein [Gemmataceae bacterium]